MIWILNILRSSGESSRWFTATVCSSKWTILLNFVKNLFSLQGRFFIILSVFIKNEIPWSLLMAVDEMTSFANCGVAYLIKTTLKPRHWNLLELNQSLLSYRRFGRNRLHVSSISGSTVFIPYHKLLTFSFHRSFQITNASFLLTLEMAQHCYSAEHDTEIISELHLCRQILIIP